MPMTGKERAKLHRERLNDPNWTTAREVKLALDLSRNGWVCVSKSAEKQIAFTEAMEKSHVSITADRLDCAMADYININPKDIDQRQVAVGIIIGRYDMNRKELEFFMKLVKMYEAEKKEGA